jgi:hypothetical protein
MGAAYRPCLCPANSLIHALRSNPVFTLRLNPACALSSLIYALRINPACARHRVAFVPCVHTPPAPRVDPALVLCAQYPLVPCVQSCTWSAYSRI